MTRRLFSHKGFRWGPGSTDLAARLAAQLRLNGVRGTAGVLARKLELAFYADVSHVWYQVAVADVRDLPLREGMVLRTGTVDDIPLIQHIPPVSAYRARARLAGGHELRLVLGPEGDVAFACWLLHGTAPALGIPGGALAMPAGVVNLEDSVSPLRHRGGGMGSAGMAQALRTLRGSGSHTVITRVAIDNTPSRKAVAKVGFTEVATVDVRRRGRRTTTAVRPVPGSEGSWLVSAFAQRAASTP